MNRVGPYCQTRGRLDLRVVREHVARLDGRVLGCSKIIPSDIPPFVDAACVHAQTRVCLARV